MISTLSMLVSSGSGRHSLLSTPREVQLSQYPREVFGQGFECHTRERCPYLCRDSITRRCSRFPFFDHASHRCEPSPSRKGSRLGLPTTFPPTSAFVEMVFSRSFPSSSKMSTQNLEMASWVRVTDDAFPVDVVWFRSFHRSSSCSACGSKPGIVPSSPESSPNSPDSFATHLSKFWRRLSCLFHEAGQSQIVAIAIWCRFFVFHRPSVESLATGFPFIPLPEFTR